jgi:deazaflavin-dependent oxidoreductase (nitroreductase family)
MIGHLEKEDAMTNTPIQRPRGWLKIFFKVPVLLARMGLAGWERLLGLEWMLLVTIGRKSGKKRFTMVDVLLYDRETDTYFIEVGFGKNSDWYQNIQVNPDFEAKVGRRRFKAKIEELPRDTAGDVMVNFVRCRPAYSKSIMKMIGTPLTTEEELRKIVINHCTLLAVHPRK